MALDNPAFSRNKAFASEAKTTTATAAPSAEALQQLYESPAGVVARHRPDDGRRHHRQDGDQLRAARRRRCGRLGVPRPLGALPRWSASRSLSSTSSRRSRRLRWCCSTPSSRACSSAPSPAVFEAQWPGIVVQAVLATIAVIAVTLALFASGKIRASARATKVFLIAMVGYLALLGHQPGADVDGREHQPVRPARFGRRSSASRSDWSSVFSSSSWPPTRWCSTSTTSSAASPTGCTA